MNTQQQIHYGLPHQTTLMDFADLADLIAQVADHENRITTLEILISAFGTAFRSGNQDVTAGTVTVTFPEVPITSYIPFAIIITAEGNESIPVINIDPLTDSRTTSSFTLEAQEAGRLYWAINAPVTAIAENFRSGSDTVTAGTYSASFAALPTANYTVYAFVITAGGDLSIPVPQVPPLTDTRTVTGFDLDVQEAGTIYWVVLYGTPQRTGYVTVAATGTQTITFSAVASADYIPVVYLITDEGNLTIPTPQLPPLSDSRTVTQFEVDAQELGVIQWEF